MKKRFFALLTMAALVLGLMAAAKPVTADAAAGTLRVGYASVNIDPIDKEGKYRKVDYTYILEATTQNAALRQKLAAAGITLDNPVYTVPTLQFDCDGNGTKDDGYFSVPLAGYGSTYERMSAGKMDDNGDGKINSKDGMFVTCIAITDELNNTMLFFSLDLIAANNTIVADVKPMIQAALKEKYGAIRADHIMFTASHSHSSPDIGLDNNAPLNSNAAQRAYIALIKDRFVEAAKSAMADRCEATAKKGEIQATNMNSTRHYNITESKKRVTNGVTLSSTTAQWVHGDNFGRGLPTDENMDNSPISSGGYQYTYQASNVSKADNTVHLVEFIPKDGDAPIVMVNFRAHPKLNSTATTRFGLDNRDRTSPDFTAPLREKLEKYGYRAAYFQGAAGNQNTWNYIDDGVLGARATNTYDWMIQRHTTAVDNTTTKDCHNDRMSFIKYKSPTDNKEYTLQTGYSYGYRLADYVLNGLEQQMKGVNGTAIKTEQYFFTAAPQVYSEGLKAAVASYDAATGSAKKTPYLYKHTDGKYYNLNSIYHASSIRGRSNNATLIDAKLELNCITIGDMAFVTAPNELYDRYNLEGNQVSGNLWDNLTDEGFGTPVVLGYTNGSEGYIPNVAAYQYNQANNNKGTVPMINGGSMIVGVGAYEANTSKFAPGAGEAICQTFETMLRNLKTNKRPSTCPMCGKENVRWEALSTPDATSYATGHYYLADNLDYYVGINCYQKTIGNRSEVCIDLNGRTIRNSSTVTGRAFFLTSYATLRLMNGTVYGRGHATAGNQGGVIYMDSKSNLFLTNVDVIRETKEGQTINNGGAIYMSSGALLTVEGGSITGGETVYSGGAIYAASSASITLKNTTINGGTAGTYGGAVCVSSRVSVTMDNVTINGGSASRGGNLYMGSNAVLNLKDITLRAGVATEAGGGIYSLCSFAPENTTITGCQAPTGGGAYMENTATLTLSGNTSISGNHSSNGTTANNIYASASQIILTDGYSGTAGFALDEPSDGASVAQVPGDISNATLSVDEQEAYYNFYVENGALKIQRNDVKKNGWEQRGDDRYYYKNDEIVTGWLLDNASWYYLGSDGKMFRGMLTLNGVQYFLNDDGKMQIGWKSIQGTWYYFDTSGAMKTGWLQLGTTRYYLNADGSMVTGTVTIDGKEHKFNASGVWQGEVQNTKNGWAQENGKWYYYQNGAKATGWKLLSGVWYYLDSTGVMKTGWQSIGGVWYYFDASGAMKTGWLQQGSTWYYLKADGAMVTGTYTIAGKQHKFNASGVWQGEVQSAKTGWALEGGKWYYYQNGAKKTGWLSEGGKWYYLNTDGSMKIGWLKLGSVWYYMDSSGVMVTGSRNIGGKTYNFNSSGVCLNP